MKKIWKSSEEDWNIFLYHQFPCPGWRKELSEEAWMFYSKVKQCDSTSYLTKCTWNCFFFFNVTVATTLKSHNFLHLCQCWALGVKDTRGRSLVGIVSTYSEKQAHAQINISKFFNFPIYLFHIRFLFGNYWNQIWPGSQSSSKSFFRVSMNMWYVCLHMSFPQVLE